MIELECTRRFGKVFCSRDDILEQSQVAATKLTIQIIWSFYCAASYAIRAFSSYVLLDQYSARFRGQKRETHDCAAAALRDDTVFARSPFDDKLELRVSDSGVLPLSGFLVQSRVSFGRCEAHGFLSILYGDLGHVKVAHKLQKWSWSHTDECLSSDSRGQYVFSYSFTVYCY